MRWHLPDWLPVFWTITQIIAIAILGVLASIGLMVFLLMRCF